MASHKRPNPKLVSATREMMTVAKNLRRLRTARNHSQAFLGEILGIHQSAVSRVEKASQELSNRELVLVSNIYGKSVDDLLRGEVRL